MRPRPGHARSSCALCGVSSSERRIEVDHIVPRSRGGTNDISNLQALCDECNRGKSNTDQTDFRPAGPGIKGELTVNARRDSKPPSSDP